MKFPILFALFLNLLAWPAISEEAKKDPSKEIKLKVRWSERKAKDGKRILTVFIKNEGIKELKDVEAEIGILGQNQNEKQIEKKKINIPIFREIPFEIEVLKYIEDKTAGNGFGVSKPGVSKVANIEVIIGESKFKS